MIAGSSVQMRSVVAPIVEEAKREGFTNFKISCEVADVNYVFMPNGLSTEEVGYATKNLIKFRVLLAPGFYYFRKCLEAYDEKYHGRIKLIGWPKSDILFSPKANNMAEEIRKRLNLTFEKTVLWADCTLALPFEKWVYTEPYRVRILETMLSATEKLGVNLIIKPHLYGGVFDIRKEHYRPHVRWINPKEWGNVTTLFLVSDMLFCDGRTSVGTEFMVTGKPVVALVPPGLLKSISGYKYGKHFSEDEFPAVSTSLETLQKDIETCLDGNDSLKKLRQKHVQRIIHQPDGHASERAVEAIKKLIQ